MVIRGPARFDQAVRRLQRELQSPLPPDVRMRSICGKASAASMAASGIGHRVERPVQRDRQAGRDGQDRRDQVEVERAVAREADDRAVDADVGEIGEHALQRDQLLRTGDPEPVALAHHHTKRQGGGGDDRADQIERRRQPIALDLTDDFQAAGAARFGFFRVGDRLDDDFEKE